VPNPAAQATCAWASDSALAEGEIEFAEKAFWRKAWDSNPKRHLALTTFEVVSSSSRTLSSKPKRRRLAMAIWTEKLQIFEFVIQVVTILMINLKL